MTAPDVFEKLSPKQQKAATYAKKAYDKLDAHKQKKEREKWIAAAADRKVATKKPAEPGLEQDLKKSVDEVKKSFNELGSTIKGVFK